MKKLLNMIKEDNIYPTLVASPNKKGYYEKFGFKVENNGLLLYAFVSHIRIGN